MEATELNPRFQAPSDESIVVVAAVAEPVVSVLERIHKANVADVSQLIGHARAGDQPVAHHLARKA